MKVYVVAIRTDYEGDSVIAVCATKEDAMAIVKDENANLRSLWGEPRGRIPQQCKYQEFDVQE